MIILMIYNTENKTDKKSVIWLPSFIVHGVSLYDQYK